MTDRPVTLEGTATLVEAAQLMRERDIGDVVVLDRGNPCGIVTDRDIVVRCVANERDPATTSLADICTHQLTTVGPTDSVDHAVQLMRTHAVRRLPVVEDGDLVGMISIGDLAIDRDSSSALADISAAAPNT